MQYSDYSKLIHSMAHKKFRASGVPLDELVSRGNLIFFETIEKWNGEGNFGTYLYHELNGRMLYHETNRIEYTMGLLNSDEISCQTMTPHKEVEFMDLINNLSEEAKEVVKVIFECPQEIVSEAIGKPKRMVGNLIEVLRQRGWKYQTNMLPAFEEIRQALFN